MIKKLIISLLLLNAFAEEERSDKPLWELGLFGGAAYLPDYPAADQSHWRFIGLPFALYRGTTFRVDDQEGARARLLRKPLFEFNFSFAASFPAESDKNAAREGMPDLDWIGEIGPSLTINLLDSKETGVLQIWFPFRGAFSTDFSGFQTRGFVVSPFLLYRYNGFWGDDDSFFASYINRWATERFNDYFYEVASEYSRPGRGTFDGKGGYIGSTLFAGYALRFYDQYEMFVGSFWDSHHWAKNRYSPLFKRKSNFGNVIGFAWKFYESKERGYK